MSGAWMTTKQVAEESGRHPRSVNDALRRSLLVGVQACGRGTWRVSRREFDSWMERGAPVDRPASARLRRAS